MVRALTEKEYTLPMDTLGRAEHSRHMRQSVPARYRCAPWQWRIWFANMLRLGVEIDLDTDIQPRFGPGLLRAAAMDPPELDLGPSNASKARLIGPPPDAEEKDRDEDKADTSFKALIEMVKSLKSLK